MKESDSYTQSQWKVDAITSSPIFVFPLLDVFEQREQHLPPPTCTSTGGMSKPSVLECRHLCAHVHLRRMGVDLLLPHTLRVAKGPPLAGGRACLHTMALCEARQCHRTGTRCLQLCMGLPMPQKSPQLEVGSSQTVGDILTLFCGP